MGQLNDGLRDNIPLRCVQILNRIPMRVPAVPYLPTSQPLLKRYRLLFARVLASSVKTLSMLALLRNKFAAAYMVRGCGHRITRGLRCLYPFASIYTTSCHRFTVAVTMPFICGTLESYGLSPIRPVVLR